MKNQTEIAKTETVKVEIHPVTKETAEIKIPHYRTDGFCHYYKVFNEKLCIQVANGAWGYDMGFNPISLAFRPSTKECTEAEFLKAYKEAGSALDLVAVPEY